MILIYVFLKKTIWNKILDTELAHRAIQAFEEKQVSLLPFSNYLLPEIADLQHSGLLSFEEAFSQITPNLTIHQAAEILGSCEKVDCFSINNLLIVEEIFLQIEAQIRYSLWDINNPGPHHFSKLLNTKKSKDVFPSNLILSIHAILADPKGLNLRNITMHGFQLDISLSYPLLQNLRQLVFPLLPIQQYHPPEFPFSEEIEQFNFFKPKLNIPDTLLGFEYAITTRFPLLDSIRLEVLKAAYEKFYQEEYKNSLLLLFPLFEHSLRRAACSLQNFSADRLCASSDEHFLSIQEIAEFLPENISNMILDLLFAPNGPRIRDRLMHGGLSSITREFAFLTFVLFEKCCQYFDNENNVTLYSWAFHPIRCYEYEIYKCLVQYYPEFNGVPFDLMSIYDPRSCSKLTESVSLISSISQDCDSKIPSSHQELFKGPYQKFIVCSSLILMSNKPKESTLKHFLTLVHSAIKLHTNGDLARFTNLFFEKAKILQRHIPFLSQVDSPSSIIDVLTNPMLLDSVFNSFIK